MNPSQRVRQVPRHAWIDEDSYFYHLYQARKAPNPLYREMARVFHDALPDEVADLLVDELMNAEARGELEQFRIDNHMPKVVDLFIAAVKKLAVPMRNEAGQTVLAVPWDDLQLLKSAAAASRLMR